MLLALLRQEDTIGQSANVSYRACIYSNYMTLHSFLALLGVWLVVLLSPGPDIFQVIRVGAKSRTAGVACSLGIMLGNTMWVTASLLGLSALIQSVPDVLSGLQILGGGYLCWMGVHALRSGLAARHNQDIRAADTAEAMSGWRAFRLGIITNLSNPKAVLFFGAVFAQFITPNMGWQSVVLIVASMVTIGLVLKCPRFCSV